jgi:hypothetical protein
MRSSIKEEKNYAFKHIGNADETTVYFDMPRNYTVDAKGAKEVKLEAQVMKAACNSDDLHNC